VTRRPGDGWSRARASATSIAANRHRQECELREENLVEDRGKVERGERGGDEADASGIEATAEGK
jgi:hypothetical protein